MKTLLVILFLFAVIVSCVNQENNQVYLKKLEKTEFIKEGFWVLSEYFDSINTNKSIADYRIQDAVWSSLAIKVTKDSIFSYGSIIDVFTSYIGDTFYIQSTTSGSWRGVFDSSSNQIIFVDADSSDKYHDSTTYHFNKREDLLFLTDSIYSKSITSLYKSIDKYLNQKLFSDTFLLNGREVIFNNNCTEGFKDFNAFHINTFFGTYHPIFEDNISFYNTKDSSRLSVDYIWEFSKDTLFLTPLIFPDYMYNGKMMRDGESHTIDYSKTIHLIKKASPKTK